MECEHNKKQMESMEKLQQTYDHDRSKLRSEIEDQKRQVTTLEMQLEFRDGDLESEKRKSDNQIRKAEAYVTQMELLRGNLQSNESKLNAKELELEYHEKKNKDMYSDLLKQKEMYRELTNTLKMEEVKLQQSATTLKDLEQKCQDRTEEKARCLRMNEGLKSSYDLLKELHARQVEEMKKEINDIVSRQRGVNEQIVE